MLPPQPPPPVRVGPAPPAMHLLPAPPPILPPTAVLLAGVARSAAVALANFALGFACGYAAAAFRRVRAATLRGASPLTTQAALPPAEPLTSPYEENIPDSPPLTSSADPQTPSEVPLELRVTQLWVYPIKSCAGVPVESACVTHRGLTADRLFMLVDGHGRGLSQKTEPRLALVQPVLEADGALHITVPGRRPFRLAVRKWGTRRVVSFLGADADAIDQGDEVADFFAGFLAMPAVRLVRMREGYVKPVMDKAVQAGKFQTSFSDGFPYLITSEASLADVTAKLGKPLSMIRFRPNIVVAAAQGMLRPFEEDAWKRVSIGEKSQFLVAKPCARCKVIVVLPEKGERDPENEPTETLRKYRSFGSKLVFGQNMVPTQNARERAVIKVGDLVTVTEVLTEVPIPDEPSPE